MPLVFYINYFSCPITEKAYDNKPSIVLCMRHEPWLFPQWLFCWFTVHKHTLTLSTKITTIILPNNVTKSGNHLWFDYSTLCILNQTTKKHQNKLWDWLEFLDVHGYYFKWTDHWVSLKLKMYLFLFIFQIISPLFASMPLPTKL